MKQNALKRRPCVVLSVLLLGAWVALDASGQATGGISGTVTDSSGSADAFESRNFYDLQKSPFHQNQFGGSLGGPRRRTRLSSF